jgi:hypothetical protein
MSTYNTVQKNFIKICCDTFIYFREVGGLVGSASACYGSSPSSNPDSSQKYKTGDISKGVALANTLYSAKN